MIYTSDNEIYEDEMAHALGVKHEDSIHYKDYLSTMNVGPKPTPEETQIGPNQDKKPVIPEGEQHSELVPPKPANDNVPIIPPDPYGGALLMQKYGPKGPQPVKTSGLMDTDNPKPPKNLPTEPFPGIDTTREQPPYGRYGPGPKEKYPPWLKEPVPFKLLDVVPNEESSADLVQHMSKSDEELTKVLQSVHTAGDLSDVPPSKNIENRRDYDTLDFKHPFQREVAQFIYDWFRKIDNTSEMGHQLGREDYHKMIDEAIDKTKLKTWARKREIYEHWKPIEVGSK
jgi:hypothetical protein